MSACKYEDLTLGQLKEELRKRKAKLSGRKRDLVARLQFLDTYNGDKNQAEPEVEFHMSLPCHSQYKDLHAGMSDSLPAITVKGLDDYLAQFDKQLDKKVKDLYNQRYLRFVRVATNSTTDYVFISSMVWAEMRKSTAYKVDLSLDIHGIVQQAQCECGAGQGPRAHCKHVSSVLYGLACFTQSKDILTELTCTQVLQKFHKSQSFKGSPLKCDDLQAMRSKNSSGSLIYDPRPEHMRNHVSYQNHFTTVCINASQQAMPVLQLFPPANMHALCHDHDYMAATPEDKFLEANFVSNVTPEQVCNVEEMTRGQGSNVKWKNIRLTHITSSNFGTVCKATDRRNLKAFAKKLTIHQDLKAKAVLHGKKYERIACEQFESKWGQTTEECGIFICEEYPQLAGSPDRLVGQDSVLEIKCPYSSRESMITDVTVPYLKREDGNLILDRNHDYFYQVQGQLLCSKRDKCIFVVFTFKDIVRIDIKRDDEFIKVMVKKLLDFYSSHFKSAIVNKFLYKDYYDYDFKGQS